MSNAQQFFIYLNLYAAKDLANISDLFSEEITLRDWNISVSGKAAAVAETRKNFESAHSIVIEPLHLYEATGAVAGELRITVNETEILHVMDVLTFDDAGKIKSIRAYLGRAD